MTLRPDTQLDPEWRVYGRSVQAQAWRDTLANQREHRVTRKIPALLVSEERPHLLPLGEPYDTDEIRSIAVPPSFRVAFDGNRYSVPWRLVGKPLTLRADAETVTFWYGTHRVARHARCCRRGVEVVTPAQADGLLATKPGAQAHWQVAAVQALGPAATRYLDCIRAGTRSLKAELEHLLLLTTLYGPVAVEAALAACLAQAIVGSRQVEQWGVSEGIWKTSAPSRKSAGTPTGIYTGKVTGVTASGYVWDATATSVTFVLK